MCCTKLERLVGLKLWPGTPHSPNIAFSFSLMELVQTLILECQVSLLDVAKMIDTLSPVQRNEVHVHIELIFKHCHIFSLNFRIKSLFISFWHNLFLIIGKYNFECFYYFVYISILYRAYKRKISQEVLMEDLACPACSFTVHIVYNLLYSFNCYF